MPCRLKKFLSLSISLKALTIEALFLQYLTGLILLSFPFRSIPGLFSNFKSLARAPDTLLLETIRDAIRYAGHVSIWKNKCLVQSLAARLMLRRRNIDSRLCLGVDIRRGQKMTAHAWLISNGVEVVPKNGDWQELWSF